jgi:hypothetical protein
MLLPLVGLYTLNLKLYWQGHLVTGIAYFAIQVYPAWFPVRTGSAVQVTTYALSVGTTTLSTIIIVTRILLVSRMPGASKQPHLAAEIITESAVLYTISALIYIAMIAGSYHDAVYANIFFAYMAVRSLLFLALHSFQFSPEFCSSIYHAPCSPRPCSTRDWMER